MVNQVIGVTIKGVGDFSDVVSNVGSVQKALTKLKLPDKLGENLNKNISNFMKEYDKYQKKITEGIHTQGDQNAVNKSLNSMLNSYEKIIKDFGKISSKDFKDIFNLDEGQFASVQKRIKDIEANIKKIKLDPKQLTDPLKTFQEATKAKSLFGNGKGFDRLNEAFKTNNLEQAKQAIIEIDNYLTRFGSRMDPTKFESLKNVFIPLKQHVLDSDNAAKVFTSDVDKLNNELSEIGGRGVQELNQLQNGLKGTDDAAKSVITELKQIHANEFDFNRQAADIDRQIQSYFGLSQMIRKVGDIARDAFATVKELDAAMTQTAVVTNFSVGDMWDMLPTYTAQANQLGSTIKDVYEAATLYYQQGLNTNQAMGLANETLKMARIAGLDAADATNMMTAALRGFNMEINQMSAQKVNDIYSELAAITASDTKEIGSAMERTASIANSANMEFATTSAFLAQMIETTREAPENLGTAMKTIVARFQEMKQDPTKLIDSEGVAMDANKVDKALKTIGVNLMNTKGEFRDLDDVFLDIASKWDSLSQGQQRYIATIAAGSRQQSRFIAMMSDYERTMELVDAANNSAGASQRQFEKTLDSMEAKLNMLKNAWNQFTMGLMNNQILKFGVDRLTDAFTIINNLIDLLGGHLPDPFGGITKSVLTLVTTLGMLNFGKKASRGLIMGGAGWWKGESSFTGGFAEGWKSSGQPGFFGRKGSSEKQGLIDGQAYARGFQKGSLNIDLAKDGFLKTMGSAYKQMGKKAIGWDTIQANKQMQAVPVSAIVEQLLPSNAITVEATKQLQECIDAAEGNVRAGLVEYKHQTGKGTFLDDKQAADLQKQYEESAKQMGKGTFEEGASKAEKFSTSINNAGISLQRFGAILQGTPLEPFGVVLSTVGSLLTGFGSTISWVSATFTAAVPAGVTGLAALKAGIIGVTESLMASPVFWVVAAIMGIVAAAKILDAAIISNKEQLEAATDAAAAASEAYDSAKQETSELADAIDTIRETDSAFDGLVAGTAEFNEQLVTANEQIMALIDKYPMLNNAQYLSTDKNGLMHINEAGFKAVKEYQKQIQARASAMNLIQTADLNALENQQKAQQLRNSIKTNMSDDEQSRILRNADLLEQRAEAETKLAHLNAIRVGLVDKEIADQEKLASIYVDQYEAKKQAAEVEVNAMGKHDIRQAYADYHGYTYDKSTKKIKDVEGNEIDYDDAAIKDEVIEQTVMLDFEANASSLEGILHSLDRDFSKTLDGAFENSSTFISDVLSNNVEANEDLLQQVLDNPEQLNNFVKDLSVKELAAVLGVSEEAVQNNVDSYKQQLEDKLLTNAQNIIDTNAQANGELAAMLAQAQGKTANEVLINKNTQKGLIEQVRNFTSEQRNTLLNIGKTLEESAGSEAMSTFVSSLSDIYRSNNEELITATQDWVDSVNWETAIGRLKGYNEAINMTTENTEHLGKESVQQLNNLGQSLMDSQDEANLLGEAFEEFYNSTDFQEMAENMDKFVDSSGQLNAASVMDMAEECHSLNNLLDTGAISAGGVAAALNALGSSGDLVLSDLNSKVLELLSSFGQLDGIIASAHRSIENFDWGIDTGESADFVKESAEKWNELYNGGEVGNPQLEAYAKYVLGEEKYINLLASHSGDLQATMDDVSKYVNEYADGFDKAWDSLAKGDWQGKVPKELQDLNISFGYDENGNWEWDPGSATTEQLSEWLQAVKGIGPEMAAAMIEDWQNYSPNFRAERQKNDFEAGLDSYIEQRRGADGGVAITASELNTIAASTGQEIEDVTAAIAERAGIEADQVDILQNINENTGEYVTDGAALNKELTQTLGAKGQNGWLAAYQAKDSNGNPMKNTIDIENAMAGAVERGYTAAQAKSMAYESYTNAEQQGKDYYYKGELLEAGQYKTLDQFAARLEEIDQNEQWVTVGQAMADGFLNRMNELENPETSSNKNNTTESSTSNIPKGTTVPGVGYVAADGTVIGRSSQYDNAYAEGLAKNKEIASQIAEAIKGLFVDASEKNKPDYQKEQPTNTSDFMNWFLGKDLSNNNLQEAGSKLQEAGTQIEAAASKIEGATSKLDTSAQNLTTAAATIVSGSNNNNKNNNSSTVPGIPQTAQPNQSSVSGAIVVDNSAALTSLDEVYQKAVTTAGKINEGATFTIETPGLTKLTKAADAAKKVTDNAGSKSISLDTSVSGASADNINTIKDSVKKFNALGNHTVTLKTNLKGASVSSIEEIITAINTFHSKTDKTVTLKTVKETITKEATGARNHGSFSAPTFGSAAGGYGQVGPKGRGGLTLTGELGYEIAWLPSENRSMVLGANGPQMVNLPGDAVVWTHEQSKKILKQKAIPAGSLSTSTRPSSTPAGGGGNNPSKAIVDTAKKTGDKLSKTAEDTSKAIARVLVWWDNAARRAEAIQRKMDNSQREFDKYIKNMQATLKTTGTTGKGNEFIANTQAYITEQERQLNKATAELNTIDNGKAAKTKKGRKKQYVKGADNIVEVSYTKGKKQKTAYMNTAGYIYQDANGAYQIDQAKLNKIKNTEQRKNFADALNKEINDRTAKRNKAEDEIRKAEEALEKFGEELYNTFFAWEIELTRIWNITQKIEKTEAEISRIKSYQELLNAQIANGTTTADKSSINSIISAFKTGIEEERKNIQLNIDSLNQQRTDLQNLLNISDDITTLENVQAKLTDSISGEGKKLDDTEVVGYKKYAKELESTIDTQIKAWEFMSVQQFDDGTIDVNFDTQKFEDAKLAGDITGDQGKAIQDYVKSLIDSSKGLSDTYNTLTNSMVEMNNSLASLQDEWAGYADDLWKISEEEQKEQVDNLKKLNDSLTNSLKNLLDDVKRKLDQRRKQEDNAKTEQDISRKQQRLAALRANTSGGHQVEIAQLESEIAEAQQNYQRTLEDQLLDNLQQQADLAAEQRERQITLQEETINAINNAQQVDLWMAALSNPNTKEDDIEKIKAAIWEGYKSENYDKAPKALQEKEQRAFEAMIAGLRTNQTEQTEVKKTLEDLNTNREAISGKLETLTDLKDTLNIIKGSVQSLSSIGVDKNAPIANTVTGSTDTLVQQAETEAAAKAASAARATNTTPVKTFPYGKASDTSGTIQKGDKGNKVKAIQWAIHQLGYGLGATPTGTYGDKTVKAVKSFQKAVGVSQTGKVGDKTRKKFKALGYKTGGLATSTGPAWLDGTPSKPELVLNARDTQNFIALKDVLAKAMNGVGDTSNTYGDILYEININVDKIEKDYDVDRVVDKVKKEIIKGAGYRNVTQVRNLR